MTRNHEMTMPFFSPALVKSVLIGAGIAMVIIMLFVLPVQGNTEWGAYWKIRPIVVTTIAGAMGGAFFHFIQRMVSGRRWRKVLAVTFGVFVYVVGLWLGSVLGMDGTLWN